MNKELSIINMDQSQKKQTIIIIIIIIIVNRFKSVRRGRQNVFMNGLTLEYTTGFNGVMQGCSLGPSMFLYTKGKYK